MQLFFYGTLMDPDMRRLVVGEEAESRLRIRPGVLLGYRRLRARDGNDPMLLPARGARLTGQLVDGLRGHPLMRVAQFEGEEYEPRQALALDDAGRRLRLWLFVPRHPHLVGRRPWNFRRWQREHKPRQLRWVRFWLRECPPGTMMEAVVPWHVRRRLAEIERGAGTREATDRRAAEADEDVPEEAHAFALSSAAE